MYKGLIFHTLAKIVFVLSGYVMHYFLGIKLTPYEYGVVGSLTTILDFEYLFLNNGVRQAISKGISQNKYSIKDLFLKGFFFQIIIIAILCAFNLLLAEPMGSILNDEAMSFYIRMAALLIPFNGIYFVILGVINGLSKFKTEAILSTIYPLLKLSVIPLVLFVFSDAVLGTEMGYFTAVFGVCVLSVAALFVYRSGMKNGIENKIEKVEFIKEATNFSLFFIVVSILLSVDTLILKAVESNGDMVGYYTGAVTFGKVSYYLLSAFYIVLLPTISKNYEHNEMDKAKKTISDMLLIICTFILPIATILSATSRSLLVSFYQPDYARADMALSLLVFNNFFVGMIVVLNMIISSTKKKSFSSILSIVLVAIQTPLCYVLAKEYSLTGAAFSGFVCSICAMLVSGVVVKKIFGTYIGRKHIMCILFNVVLYGLIKCIPWFNNVQNLLVMIVIYFVLYCFVLLVLRGIKVFSVKEIITIFKGDKE